MLGAVIGAVTGGAILWALSSLVEHLTIVVSWRLPV